MACHLFCTKPSPEPMVVYFWTLQLKWISIKILNLLSRKWVWKCQLQNVCLFVQASEIMKIVMFKVASLCGLTGNLNNDKKNWFGKTQHYWMYLLKWMNKSTRKCPNIIKSPNINASIFILNLIISLKNINFIWSCFVISGSKILKKHLYCWVFIIFI